MLKTLADLMCDPAQPGTALKYKVLRQDDTTIINAIFYNDKSKTWYWTEDGIGYFLPEDTTYVKRKSDFYHTHRSEFSDLGLPEEKRGRGSIWRIDPRPLFTFMGVCVVRNQRRIDASLTRSWPRTSVCRLTIR
jgi:uncharacterized protein YbaR (Trm112 family)